MLSIFPVLIDHRTKRPYHPLSQNLSVGPSGPACGIPLVPAPANSTFFQRVLCENVKKSHCKIKGESAIYESTIPLRETKCRFSKKAAAGVTVNGSRWQPGETVTIILQGPLNSLAVGAGPLSLGVVNADANGNLSGSLSIPFDSGIVGPSARIPQPGHYQVQAFGSASGLITGPQEIDLSPATFVLAAGFDWGHERGGRDGVLPGVLHDVSPERADPECATLWHEVPAAVYGTIAPTDANGDSQPAEISFSDNPAHHYAHDANFFVVPDPQFRWLIGTSNYYQKQPTEPQREQGRLEIEWETLNGGNTFSYGQGQIGLPIWANPTTDDRVYVVGRWILDVRHPELGSRSEIHPPRLLATIRKRPAITQIDQSSAQQVDIYVSGHGGGANQVSTGLSTLLDQGGEGGGRIKDALSPSDQTVYYQAGPLAPSLVPLVAGIAFQLTGQSLTGPIFPNAGPSAFPFGTLAPETHAVNDMDYDFDVPLPRPPDGAISPRVEAVTHPEHATAVNEAITFTNFVDGLPTTAHIHLPYNGADNGVYARTLKFAWDTFSPPGKHFRITINSIHVTDLGGEWHLWTDVSGQWVNLSSLVPGQFLHTMNGQDVNVPGAQFDVFLRNQDKLRVLTQGYRAQCLDHLFGFLFGRSSYIAELALFQNCGGVRDNDDLGGALLTLPARPSVRGVYNVGATDNGNPIASHFQMNVTVEFIPGEGF